MAVVADLGRVRSRTVVMLSVAVAWLGMMIALAGLLSASQASARRGVAERLAVRATSGAEFASLYIQDIFARERRQAAVWLAAREVAPMRLQRAAGAVGFSASVLLNDEGRVLQAVPAKPGLVGQMITGKYPHLAAAVAGTTAVSNVVASAARGVPVVAFAVPFETASGRRVFSGAFDVAHTPLGAYLNHLFVVPGFRVYLVDTAESLIASSGVARTGTGVRLDQLDRRLAELVQHHASGTYASAGRSQFFVSAAVGGTPWRMIVAVPAAGLYVSVNGASKSLAWVALVSLAIAGLMIIVIGSRLLRSRRRLAALNSDLDRLARVDSLTGLRNRRDVEETLLGSVSFARRHKSNLAVLLIDIDHFKHLNDTLGHQAGDATLIATSQTLQAALRTEDTIGRWGGEEFLAVLPHTDVQGALIIAERLRAQVAKPETGGSDPRSALTVTIGVAVWTSGGIDDLISRADAALYAGKTRGRNNVQLASAEQASRSPAPV